MPEVRYYVLYLCALVIQFYTIHNIQTLSTRHHKITHYMNQSLTLNTTTLVRLRNSSSTLPSKRHIDKSKSVYYIVTLPVHAYSNPERLHNVLSITSQYPEVTIFHASHYLDMSCLATLSKMHVTVSPSYKSDEKGTGWVHAGKIGHWCSFLRFILECDQTNSAFCVWLEDDVMMTRDLMKTIRNHTKDYGTPIIAMGKGDEVNVIVRRYTKQLIKHFTNYTIRGPVDVIRDNSFLRTSLYLFDARMYHAKQHSTLVCDNCPILPVSEVNHKIHETRVRLHLKV